MTQSRILMSSIAALSLVTVSGCVTDPNTGEKKVSRTVLGGVGGAVAGGLLGDVIGGKTGRIIGAAGGAAAGGYVGYKMDQQIKELKEETAGTGVDVTEVDGGEAIMLNLPDGVTFATGSSTISPGFQTVLDRVANNLVQYPNSLVDVYGHTDSVGSASSNQLLSERRAQSVTNHLIQGGVASARIRWMGFGETQLKVQTGDNVAEALNRRVEIKIIPFDEQDVQAAQQGS